MKKNQFIKFCSVESIFITENAILLSSELIKNESNK